MTRLSQSSPRSQVRWAVAFNAITFLCNVLLVVFGPAEKALFNSSMMVIWGLATMFWILTLRRGGLWVTSPPMGPEPEAPAITNGTYR